MSVEVISKWESGMTAETYHQLAEAMNLGEKLPKGCESHTAGITDDGAFIITDIWESTEAFETFAHDRLAPTSDVLNIPNPDKVTTLRLVMHSAEARSFHLSHASGDAPKERSFHLTRSS
jgi:hypothetical protein